MPKNKSILTTQSSISSVGKTSGFLQTTPTTYNSSTTTYNSPTQVYGGLAGNQDSPPSNESFISFIPKNKTPIWL